MKVSRAWLQTYFDTPLPDTQALSDALTFHAFEIEETVGDMLDVKVLPNRAADCLSHRGIAKELSAILNLPLKTDPLRQPLPYRDIVSPYLTVEIEDSNGFDKLTAGKCLRYMGAVVRGVKVRPSPSWLKEALEAVGQRSVNNIVDATNYVMLDIGQPLHAFDAKGISSILVRDAREGEKMTILSGEEYTVPKGTLLITNAGTSEAIGIAGVKGGKAAEVTAATADLIIESANFDGTSIRRTAQVLKLSTDASQRFQNRPSPELCAYGIREVLALIQKIAGGEIAEVVDEYPARPQESWNVSVSLAKMNGILGSRFTKKDVADVFTRLGLEVRVDGDTFTVTPPFERTHLTNPEDLVEEVGRIIGYDKLQATELPFDSAQGKPDQACYRGIEKIKDELVVRGFTEISTQSFARKGDVVLANPLDKSKPALRKSLKENMREAFERAKYAAPLVLPPNQKPRLFEIGTVFTKAGEELAIETSEPVSDLPKKIQNDENYEPPQYRLGAYQPFSVYPFIVRDIALWMPAGTDDGLTKSLIQENTSELLVRLDQFDRFEKEGRVSLAFRLVFQSNERSLTNEEVNGVMERIYEALKKAGFEVR